MYRRDFKRIQAKRAGALQSSPGKEPVKMEMGRQMVVPPIKKKKPEVPDNKGLAEREDLGTADAKQVEMEKEEKVWCCIIVILAWTVSLSNRGCTTLLLS